jgi:4'-phosphopantetheinyl transferase
MSGAERERWERFRHEPTRLRHLNARGLQREVLSRYHAAVAPAEWQFETAANGKPRIAAVHGVAGLEFNLTHTEGLTALAVTRDAWIGVDAENVTRGASLDIAQHYFTRDEVAALEGLEGAARQMRFYELWTLKEAWLKATGSGLATPLDRISFDFAREAAVVADEPAGSWHFSQFHPHETHVLAIAVNQSSAPVVQVREIGADGEPRDLPLAPTRAFVAHAAG